MFFIFLIIALLGYWCGSLYISRRTKEAISKAQKAARVSVSLFFIIASLMPFFLIALRFTDIPNNLYSTIFNGFCVWMVFIFYASLIQLLFDTIKRLFLKNVKNFIII